ncbi:hypothetical protein Ancab_004555 [Ancistrocladus abbreviatus]
MGSRWKAAAGQENRAGVFVLVFFLWDFSSGGRADCTCSQCNWWSDVEDSVLIVAALLVAVPVCVLPVFATWEEVFLLEHGWFAVGCLQLAVVMYL